MFSHIGQSLIVVLAIIGQVGGTIGLPILRSQSGSISEIDSECGCCPADREAKRCCCVKDTGPSCCSPKPALAKSCCSEVPEEPKPVRVVWAIPALRSKCLGPFDTTVASTLFLPCLSPNDAAITLDPLAVGDSISTYHLKAVVRNSPPDAPPPRRAEISI